MSRYRFSGPDLDVEFLTRHTSNPLSSWSEDNFSSASSHPEKKKMSGWIRWLTVNHKVSCGMCRCVFSVVVLSCGVVSMGSVTRNHPHLPTPGAHQLISHSLHSLALQDTSQHRTTSVSNSAGAASQRLCYSCSGGWIRVVLPLCACLSFASQDFPKRILSFP